jgi:prolyl oligopeptidase
MQLHRCAGVLVGLMIAAGIGAATIPPPPAAPIEPVVDEYFGTRVTDNYRWMEDRSAPRFVDWIKGQDSYARAVLKEIPGRDELLRRVAAHSAGGVVASDARLAGGKTFYLKRAPGEESFRLYVRTGVGGLERLLVDPDRLATPGHHFAIDYYEPSWDGMRVAYGLSQDGSENSVIHVIETTSFREAAETIDRTEYGSPKWRADGKSFFYNRFAKLGPGAVETDKYLNSRAQLHVLGTDPERDVALIGTNLTGTRVPVTPVDVPIVATAAGSPYEFAVIDHGAEPAVTIYIAKQTPNAVDAAWRKVADTEDAVTGLAVHGRKLYLLTHKDAARYKVLQTDADAPDLNRATTVIAASERVVESISAAADGLYVRDLDAGQGRIRKVDYDTGAIEEVALPGAGSVIGPTTDPTRAGALFSLQGWVSPEHFYRVAAREVQAVDLVPPWSDDLSAYTAVEVRAAAADGTAIPLSIVYKRGLKLDGHNPVWLTGYGAYGVAANAHLLTRQLALLEDGGVYAVAHVRGGGEFGEDWHRAGFMATKPNTYRDLIACAEYLIHAGYGNASSMAIEGASAGGITVGMALAERPDLFRVAISRVGDSNTLRSEYGTDGPANSLEYGSTATQAGFDALYAVDSTQHLKDHTPYPAVLLTTGMNDPRVAPWQPGKMTARLQATTSSRRPVILLADFGAGHGIGSTRSQRDSEYADQLAFLYWQIGRPDYQPRATAPSSSEEFESPPDQSPAALLPPSMAAGENYQVQDPVHSDGLMHRFVLDTPYGKFDAYGRIALELRLREVAALTRLAKISPLQAVASGVGNGLKSEVSTVSDVAKRPVATLTGIPRGVSHLFQGFVAQGKEVAAGAKQATESKPAMAGSSDAAARGPTTLDKGRAAAQHYADRYFGVTAADRRWYKKLGVDPYTSNPVLRQAVHKDAKLDATAAFGMRFVALPEIAGLGIAREAMDAIYNEDPAVLRARQRQTLTALGLTPVEVDHWQNNLVLSPTRQTLLLEAAQALDGVAGRAELFRHAMGLTSETEAQVYLRSVGLLVVAHREQPVESVLPGVRLPAARRAGGGIVVCGAFEAIYWTSDVAVGEREIRDSLPAINGQEAREIWLEGTVSERAQREFARLGWQIHENLGLLPPVAGVASTP